MDPRQNSGGDKGRSGAPSGWSNLEGHDRRAQAQHPARLVEKVDNCSLGPNMSRLSHEMYSGDGRHSHMFGEVRTDQVNNWQVDQVNSWRSAPSESYGSSSYLPGPPEPLQIYESAYHPRSTSFDMASTNSGLGYRCSPALAEPLQTYESDYHPRGTSLNLTSTNSGLGYNYSPRSAEPLPIYDSLFHQTGSIDQSIPFAIPPQTYPFQNYELTLSTGPTPTTAHLQDPGVYNSLSYQTGSVYQGISFATAPQTYAQDYESVSLTQSPFQATPYDQSQPTYQTPSIYQAGHVVQSTFSDRCRTTEYKAERSRRRKVRNEKLFIQKQESLNKRLRLLPSDPKERERALLDLNLTRLEASMLPYSDSKMRRTMQVKRKMRIAPKKVEEKAIQKETLNERLKSLPSDPQEREKALCDLNLTRSEVLMLSDSDSMLRKTMLAKISTQESYRRRKTRRATEKVEEKANNKESLNELLEVLPSDPEDRGRVLLRLNLSKADISWLPDTDGKLRKEAQQKSLNERLRLLPADPEERGRALLELNLTRAEISWLPDSDHKLRRKVQQRSCNTQRDRKLK